MFCVTTSWNNEKKMGASIRPKSVSHKGKACLEGVQTDPDRSCSPLEVLYNWHTLQLI